MALIVLDDNQVRALQQATDLVELRDQSGALIGYVTRKPMASPEESPKPGDERTMTDPGTRRRSFSRGSRRLIALQHFQRISRHPDVNLLKARLKALFEFDKELEILRHIGNIAEHSHLFVAIQLVTVTPATFDVLCLGRHGAKAFFQFQQRVGK